MKTRLGETNHTQKTKRKKEGWLRKIKQATNQESHDAARQEEQGSTMRLNPTATNNHVW